MRKLLFALIVLLGLGSPVLASSTEQWIAGNGVGLTWTDVCGVEVKTTAITAGNAVQCSVVVTNATALDIFADFSVNIASVTTAANAPYIGLYLYPLNEDGTTYGDGQFGSAASGSTLAGQYFACAIPAVASATAAVVGNCRGVILPPGSFKMVFYNNLGVATTSSGNSVQYRTYNRQAH